VRILPPSWDGAKHYGFDLWVNYGIGVDNQSYLSLSRMKGEKDPIAEARREAERAGDRDLVKALNPRQRILMWVIDRNDEDEGPQLWAAPFTVDKAIASLSYDEDTGEVLYVDDPEEGCDIRFYKEGQGLKTDYPPEKMRILKPTPLSGDKGQAAEWLEFVQENPLPECVQYYDYNHIATTFDGNARVERKDDDEDDEKPKRNKREAVDDDEAPPKRTKAAVDDEDDEPPFKGSSRKRAVVDPEDDEPDDKPVRGRAKVDDDDEDEKPRRRAVVDDDEDIEDKDIKPRRRAVDDDDDDEKPRGSIRDRLKRRVPVDADDD
jgi:hypothetical protein